MMFQSLSYVVLALFCINICVAQLSKKKEELLNWCLDAKLHKEKPGKEDTLHKQCLPWQDHACCTEKTSQQIHEEDMHNFNLNHCEDKKEKLSDKCREHFDRDNCFYECEPNIGLWVVKTTRKIAAERFVNVPLCASDCDSWWNACKYDYTCAFNWPRNFKFRNGVNYCPENSTCITFQEMYGDAQTFCENVWDHSWNYTADTEPCMRMWFNGSMGNPNKITAEYYIEKRFGAASTFSTSFLLVFAGVVGAIHARHSMF